MNNAWRSLPHSPGRRALLVGAAAAPWWAGRAFAQADPEVAAYKAFVGARAVRTERLVLDIPRIADNGNLVPVRIALPGPFAPGAEVKSIHLFSQKNPVAQMAVFHFPVPVGRVEVESRVRLAGTQRVAAVATLADGTLYAATADVIVTVSACIDGT
jgi:sulfur-oxidizing protein SoxY